MEAWVASASGNYPAFAALTMGAIEGTLVQIVAIPVAQKSGPTNAVTAQEAAANLEYLAGKKVPT
jgi:hypothetical protein